jgi:hypothetical protein
MRKKMQERFKGIVDKVAYKYIKELKASFD